jgi:predicted dehydrogenase
MEPVIFGIIGGGWRADFFLRAAEALPERFTVGGMLVRDAGKGEAITQRWGTPTYRTLDELLKTPQLKFIVISVPWADSPAMIRELAERKMPALAETPPAPDLPTLIALDDVIRRGARVQVAEQYAFQPLHAARIKLAQSGRLGQISQAQVSIAHGYHGASLMRKFMGLTYEDATIRAREVASPIVTGPGRDGPPGEESVPESKQLLAWLDFDGKFGVFDFTGDQYFSWVRTNRLLVRGERGEIHDAEVRYLRDHRTPIEMAFRRANAGENGNLEGLYLKGILLGDEWIYSNPFAPARLTDDEIAVATCLAKMAEYAEGGPDFYSVPEASQDHYLAMMIAEAARTGDSIRTERQPWAA